MQGSEFTEASMALVEMHGPPVEKTELLCKGHRDGMASPFLSTVRNKIGRVPGTSGDRDSQD